MDLFLSVLLLVSGAMALGGGYLVYTYNWGEESETNKNGNTFLVMLGSILLIVGAVNIGPTCIPPFLLEFFQKLRGSESDVAKWLGNLVFYGSAVLGFFGWVMVYKYNWGKKTADNPNGNFWRVICGSLLLAGATIVFGSMFLPPQYTTRLNNVSLPVATQEVLDQVRSGEGDGTEDEAERPPKPVEDEHFTREGNTITLGEPAGNYKWVYSYAGDEEKGDYGKTGDELETFEEKTLRLSFVSADKKPSFVTKVPFE